MLDRCRSIYWRFSVARTALSELEGTLAREMAVGNVRASTTGSLLGSFGPALTVAGIAGFILYEAIHKNAQEVEKFNKELQDTDAKIDKTNPSWRTTHWQRTNQWFETELLPELRRRVTALVAPT